jgi:hypothetical protein
MTNPNAFKVMCKALASAAALGVAGFLYYLWVLGVSTTGLLMALAMALFASAMTVAAGVAMFWSKAQ